MAWGDFTNPDAWKSAMANLLRRGGEVTDYIQQAPSKAGQAILDAGQRQQALMNEAFDPTGKTLIKNPQAANQAAMNLLEGPLGFMPAGITAWHGSPHTFEKFDMSKVGTGEGAQVYGHGMYFAEAPQVAGQYAKELGTKIDVNGKPLMQKGKIVGSTGNTELDDFLVANLGDVKATRKDLLQSIKEVRPTNPEGAKDYQKLLADLRKANVGTANTGNLYKVDIPDEHIPMMLDWDKPLRNQPEIIKILGIDVNKYDKLKSQRNSMPEKFDIDIPEELAQYNIARDLEKQINSMGLDKSGKKYYEDLIKVYGNQKAISNALAEKGIKGIRYFDSGSRGKAAERTSNFVVFDPTDVKILERNNQPLTRKEILEEEVNKLK